MRPIEHVRVLYDSYLTFALRSNYIEFIPYHQLLEMDQQIHEFSVY